jgi:hypothetical protein
MEYGITFSQAGSKKQSSVAVDARGLSHAAVGSDFFRPLSPESYASVALGTNVSFSHIFPAFFDVTHHFSCAIALSCFVCAGTARCRRCFRSLLPLCIPRVSPARSYTVVQRAAQHVPEARPVHRLEGICGYFAHLF